MRIGIFFEGDIPDEHREGQLVMGFMDHGISSTIITLSSPDMRTYDSSYPLLKVACSDVADAGFWRRVGVDVAIIFTHFRTDCLDILAAVRRSGAIVVDHGDSDGRMAPPVSRQYFTIPPPRFTQIPRWIAGKLLWHLYFGRREIYKLVHSFINSDAVVVESPRAVANLAHILVAARRPDSVDRLWHIPNPVCPEILNGPPRPKENVVAAVGRWDDYRQKNTMMMARVLMSFLAQRQDYWLHLESFSCRDRNMGVRGFRGGMRRCSVVGTPIETLQYASMGGLTGTLASDFTHNGLQAALLADAKKWNWGEYVPEDIAQRWRLF